MQNNASKLTPLKLTCSSTACSLGQHYYGPSKRKHSTYQVGSCRDCGTELVDWTRVQLLRIADVDYTISRLQTECWRHDWWHRPIDEAAKNHALRKGRTGLLAAIEKRVANALQPHSSFEGRQTPTTRNVIYYAQHATATCCRTCVQYWHGIPNTREIAATEQAYLAQLILRYVDLRLPLSEQGRWVPPIRRPFPGGQTLHPAT